MDLGLKSKIVARIRWTMPLGGVRGTGGHRESIRYGPWPAGDDAGQAANAAEFAEAKRADGFGPFHRVDISSGAGA